MRLKTTRVSDANLREFITEWLNRSTLKRESVSHMVAMIRDVGMKFPTRHLFAMDEFERLGFKLESDTNEYGSLLRTYVKEK